MMRLGRLIFIAILLVALLFGFLFNLENPEPVSVTLLGINLPELALGLWLLAALLAGVLVGFALSVLPELMQKRSVSRLTKQNSALEKENQLLRSQALRD